MVAPLGAGVAQTDEEFEGTEHSGKDRNRVSVNVCRHSGAVSRLVGKRNPEPSDFVLREPACRGPWHFLPRTACPLIANTLAPAATQFYNPGRVPYPRQPGKQLRPSNAVGVH